MYEPEKLPPQTRGLTAMTGAMALIIVLLIVQMWVLSATLEAYLAGRDISPFAAALFSGILFLSCFGLYLFVDRIDRQVRGR
jgi:predicted Co/Zn/Cd cation transporter (cation efflux family)